MYTSWGKLGRTGLSSLQGAQQLSVRNCEISLEGNGLLPLLLQIKIHRLYSLRGNTSKQSVKLNVYLMMMNVVEIEN